MTLFPETRSTLLAALQSPGDLCAWDEFVLIYRPVFYRMARRRGLQDADAQDLVQQVLLRICRAIETYEQQPETRFRHWLRRVANNAIATALTSTRRDAAEGGTANFEKLDAIPEVNGEISREVDAEFEREIYMFAAAKVRSEVNSTTWCAFELTMIDGMTCEDAAKKLQKSIGTIYAARSRVVKRLRMQIEHLQSAESNR